MCTTLIDELKGETEGRKLTSPWQTNSGERGKSMKKRDENLQNRGRGTVGTDEETTPCTTLTDEQKGKRKSKGEILKDTELQQQVRERR